MNLWPPWWRSPIGRRGERRAARFLRRRGYRILHRNLRVGRDEADLVALAPDERTIVLVEVKTTLGAHEPPEERIDHEKRRAMTRLAARLAGEGRFGGRPMRLDVVTVVWPPHGAPRVRHYENAVEDERD